MAKELGPFSWRVVDQIQKLIAQKGMTDAEVIRKSGMARNTFYVKMRGETALTTEDISAIASALEVDPFEIMRAATQPRLSVVPATEDVDLHEVDLEPEAYDLAASDDNTAVDPARGES